MMSQTEVSRILGEYRVDQAESLENDYGVAVTEFVIVSRAREAQFRALSKECREIADRADKMAEILEKLCQSDT